MEEQIKPERLPSKENFIEWYNTLLHLAEIADRRYPVKGTFVWMPYGLQIMKNLVKHWDRLFASIGIEEVYFPLFVPLHYARINEEWFEGFKDELFYLHDSKGEPLDLVLRPTGEPAMYPIFKMWIKDGRLPIKVYQTVSSFRKEGKTTHTMIRDREITFWYEIHTVHKTKEEAEEEVKKHIEVNEKIWREMLNIPTILVEKPSYEIFPGAVSAFEFYSILPNGRLLENGSVNNLGQAYAKKFELYYVENGEKKYCWQVCTGNGARYLVAIIALHGDERGMVVPPAIAPVQIVIVPIFTKENKEEVLSFAKEVKETLKEFRVYLDEDEKITPGEKFNIWDLKGVPIRLEIGAKELKERKITVYRRDKKTKELVDLANLKEIIKQLLEEEIPKNLYDSVRRFYSEVIVRAENWDEVSKLIKEGKIAKANWCGKKECYDEITLREDATEAIGFLVDERQKGKCVICGEETERLTLIGKVY